MTEENLNPAGANGAPEGGLPAEAVVTDAGAGATGEWAVTTEPVEPAAGESPAATSAEDARLVGTAGPDESAVSAGTAVPPQYGVGPFTVREVALVGVWLLAFVVSFFPRLNDPRVNAFMGFGQSVWGSGLDWILTIGVPTVAVGLIVLRRLSPGAIRRVGSLGIDQFASVAFAVSALLWTEELWGAFATLAAVGVFLTGWVAFASLLLMLAGVVLTVFAPLIPVLRDDFAHRAEEPAHRVARAPRPVSPRPVAPAPVWQPAPGQEYAPSAPAAYGAVDAGSTAGHAAAGHAAEQRDVRGYGANGFDAAGAQPSASVTDAVFDTAGSLAHAEAASVAQAEAVRVPSNQPFWALAPVERDVIDETGAVIFRVGPTAWALVLEDRADYFVVRHDDGRIGYLMDVSGITRG